MSNNVMGLGDLRPKNIDTMNKAELKEICDGLEIEYTENEVNDVLKQKIKESGKYVSTGVETGGGKSTKDGKTVHNILGEYKNCIVHPTEASQQNTSIFCSINLYTVEFQPRTEVKLPIGVIKFLKEATTVQHVYDKNAVSENGQQGAHIAKAIPKYIVEVL